MFRRTDYYPNNRRYVLTEDDIYTLISFIKSHEREDILDDVWDLMLQLQEEVQEDE